MKTGGQWGWEQVPYWLRGYANLAYIVQDNQMLNEVKILFMAIPDNGMAAVLYNACQAKVKVEGG